MTARRQAPRKNQPTVAWLIWSACVVCAGLLIMSFAANLSKGVLTLLRADYTQAEKSAVLKKTRQPPAARTWKA